MIDCPNGEMRDRLPDFVHGQLTGAARAEVATHVAGCSACAAELVLLRELRETLRQGPRVDVARIVAALPAAGRSAAATRGAGRPDWSRFNWRVAAAVAALAVGGGSVAVWNQMTRASNPSVETRVAGPRTPSGSGVAGVAGDSGVQRVAAANLSIDADLVEASAAELEALLRDLESFDGLPAGEPDPVAPTPGDAEGQR